MFKIINWDAKPFIMFLEREKAKSPPIYTKFNVKIYLTSSKHILLQSRLRYSKERLINARDRVYNYEYMNSILEEEEQVLKMF